MVGVHVADSSRWKWVDIRRSEHNLSRGYVGPGLDEHRGTNGISQEVKAAQANR